MGTAGRAGPLRRSGSLVGLLGVELAAVLSLHWLGRFEGLRIRWDEPVPWLLSSPVQEVLGAVLRTVGLVMAYWLLASTVLYLLASLTRLPSAVRAVRWATFPLARRVADHAVAVTLATSMVGGSTLGVAGPALATDSRSGTGPPARKPVAAAQPSDSTEPSSPRYQPTLPDETTTSTSEETTPSAEETTSSAEETTTSAEETTTSEEPTTSAEETTSSEEPTTSAEDTTSTASTTTASTTAPEPSPTSGPGYVPTTAGGPAPPQATRAPARTDAPTTTPTTAARSTSSGTTTSSSTATPRTAPREPAWTPTLPEQARERSGTGGQPPAREPSQPGPKEPKEEAERPPYQVKRGDNLWTIARNRLAEENSGGPGEPTDAEVARYWRKVIAANRHSLESGDPDLIFPGEPIVLPPVDD